MSSIHAEVNAMERTVARDFDLYVTHSPCMACAQKLMEHRVKNVYFGTPYRDDMALIFLHNFNVNVYRVTPSGYLIKHVTNELILDS